MSPDARRASPSHPRSGGAPLRGLGDTALRTILIAAGLVELALLAALGWWPGVPFPFPGLALFAGAFAAYAAAGMNVSRGRAGLWTIWLLGVAMRLVLIPLEPELTDDVWRYLWDGHVQVNGINPYLHAPGDPALDSLATPYRGLINNPGVPTIYPPVAQVAFALVALMGGALFQLKLLWLGFDLLTGWLLFRLARATGRSGRTTLLLYLWSPLLVLETAWSGHLEVLGLAGLAALLVLARPNEAPTRAPAGVAMAWTALVKFAPLAAIPPLARRLGPRFLWGFVLAAGLLYIPYASAGPELFEGLTTYARHWRFNELAFMALEVLVPGEIGPRVAAGAIVLAVVGWTTWRRFEPERALLWILAAGLILSPTLHPWYALWILPLAALRRDAAWLTFTGTVFVGYWGLRAYQETGLWPQPFEGRLLVWLPVVLLLLADRVRSAGPPALPEGR